MRGVHATLICAAALALAAPASRQPSADEQRLYDEGLRAFQAGDARAAEKSWKAGYAVGHDPAFLVHIGEAQEKAGAPAEAADSYRRYLREAPDAADRAEIEARLARLVPAAPPEPPAPSPAETPGEFGGVPEAPANPPQQLQKQPRPAPSAPDGRTAGDKPAQEDSGWNRYNITAMTSAGVAVLALGVAALFAAQASSDQEDVDRLVNYRVAETGAPLKYAAVADQYEQATADGPRHARNAKIALAVSAAAAAVATTFFVLDAKFGAEPAVAIAPVGGGFAATGGWRWHF